jgi:hypothetical protein
MCLIRDGDLVRLGRAQRRTYAGMPLPVPRSRCSCLFRRFTKRRAGAPQPLPATVRLPTCRASSPCRRRARADLVIVAGVFRLRRCSSMAIASTHARTTSGKSRIDSASATPTGTTSRRWVLAGRMEHGLEAADWLTRREIIRTLVSRVEIDHTQVNVVFRVPPDPFVASPDSLDPGVLPLCRRGALPL